MFVCLYVAVCWAVLSHQACARPSLDHAIQLSEAKMFRKWKVLFLNEGEARLARQDKTYAYRLASIAKKKKSSFLLILTMSIKIWLNQPLAKKDDSSSHTNTHACFSFVTEQFWNDA